MSTRAKPQNLAQYRVQRHFSDYDAMAPGDAIEYVPSNRAERMVFDKLRAIDVIREAMPACYWFDLDRIGRERPRSPNAKTYVTIALGIVLAALAIMLYRG